MFELQKKKSVLPHFCFEPEKTEKPDNAKTNDGKKKKNTQPNLTLNQIGENIDTEYRSVNINHFKLFLYLYIFCTLDYIYITEI